ncbi:MAG: hypothetical protein C0596_03420, partial [Marinilabiliales bacterium]
PADGASTVECLVDAVAPTTPVVVDNCGNNIVPTLVSTVDSPDPLTCEGTRTYTYEYADCAGNTTNWAYVYTIDVTTAPVVPADGAATVECLVDAVAPTTPVVVDVCGNNITPTLVSTVDSPDPLTCEGTRTYTYQYEDCAGNTINWAFVYTIDITTSPIVPADGASTVDCVIDAVAPTTPVISDVCGNNISAVLESVVDSPDPLICAGTRTYNYSYTDCSGNVEYWSYIYTISDPIITVTCPPDQSFNAIPGDNYTIPELVATDNCSGGFIVDWTITGATNRTGTGTDASGFFAVGISIINWEVTDACGNIYTCNTQVEILMPLVECPDPIAVCYDAGLQLLSGTGEDPEGGVFTGDGVVINAGQYYFDPSSPSAGVGTHPIVYTWTNPSGYEGTCTFDATVYALPEFNATVSQHPLCYNSADGIIDISITDGLPTYNIDWGTGSSSTALATTQLNNLEYGVYNIIITDANACSSQNTIELINPSELVVTANAEEIMCNGETADVIVAATGGTPIYTGTGTFAEIAGTYTYTVTDLNGCSADATVTLGQPDAMIVVANTTNALCFGLNGSSVVTVNSGGTAPHFIEWQDGSSQFTNNNIPVETTFGYTITDYNGCTYESSVFATQPDQLEATLSTVGVSCFNGEDGMASVSNVTGGTYPYFYEWNTGSYNSSISGLTAGTYYVTVRDANSCEIYESITVEQPAVLQVYLTATPAQCGGNGGSAIASVIGGTPLYSYSWSNSMAGNNITNVPPCTYTVSVTDNNNCVATQDVLINISGNIDASITTIQEVSCPGDSDGMIEATSSNGVAPLEYNWTTGETSSILTDLNPGTYVVMINDNWGCSGSASTTLVTPQSMTLNASITNTVCYGDSNGAIYLNVIGGYGPYNLAWSNAVSSDSLINLTAGDYIVTVTDSHYCTTTETYTVAQPDELILTYQVNNISCYGDLDGTVAMNATGGTTPYIFSFFTGEDYIEGATMSGIPAGSYGLLVEDYNGCSDNAEIMILEPAELTAYYTAYDPSCIGNNDGYIEIKVLGCTSPYLYGWNENYIDLPIISGLTQGDYEVMVMDSNNCVYTFNTIQLTDTDVDCIKIPNAFTPNGDGPNDTWIIENIELFPGAYMYVYNRWGQELWVGRPGDEWDGKYQGKFVPSGTYLYVINLYDGTPPYTGTVTVVY